MKIFQEYALGWGSVLRSAAVPPYLAVCLPDCPTGAAVPELQLFGSFGGNPVLLATTEQLTYFDCRSYVKCVNHSNSHMMVTRP